MRTKILAGNWKMNKSCAQTKEFFEKLNSIKVPEGRKVIICPPFTMLCPANKTNSNSSVSIGVQNVCFADKGAYTGEISCEMLKELNVEYVILGHSERREIFFETDEMINKKINQVLKNKLTPILCVGETLEERENGSHFDKVKSELLKDLKDVKETEKILIAYEPIWAIGTGKTASAEDAENMCAFIRETLKEIFSLKTASETHILYGGSAKPENIKDLLDKENIDGALIGGASLNFDDFEKMIFY